MMISNKSLRVKTIPSPEANYFDISEFALTFDGYDLPNCADLANSRSAVTLSELRAVLFFEQRRYRHFGYGPTGEDLEYIRSIVLKIRDRVATGDLN